MTTERAEPVAPVAPPSGLARVLFLVIAMTFWAEANGRLAEHFHIGRFTLIALRTVVDCGGVVGLGCVVWGERSLRDLGWNFASPLRLVGAGLLALALVLGAIAAAVVLRGGTAGLSALARDVAGQSVGEHVYFGLLGVKIAFWEETLFRGDLLAVLRSRAGTAAAVALSAVVFGFYHLGWSDVTAGLGGIFSLGIGLKMVIGAVFAWFTVRCRSLAPGALAHALLWAVMGPA